MTEQQLLDLAREWLNDNVITGACVKDSGLKDLINKKYPGGWKVFVAMLEVKRESDGG